MKKTLLFIDPNNYREYDTQTMEHEGLGGTEASVVRIAKSLANDYNVIVAQNYRERILVNDQGVNFITLPHATSLADAPDAVIIVRKYQMLEEVANKYPTAKKFVWLHTRPKKSLRKYASLFRKTSTTLCAVSQYQAGLIKQMLAGTAVNKFADALMAKRDIPVEVLYNPIEDYLTQDGTKTDKNKLVFLSSPSRGLSQILDFFREAKAALPDLKLYLAEPGYRTKEDGEAYKTAHEEEGVYSLGSLSHPDVIQQMREAFCVFYPQSALPETFGLVFAEANAVGTPVLAHDFGAASEVLSSAEQLVDINEKDRVVDTLLYWRKHGRPTVADNSAFRLSQLANQWKRIIG